MHSTSHLHGIHTNGNTRPPCHRQECALFQPRPRALAQRRDNPACAGGHTNAREARGVQHVAPLGLAAGLARVCLLTEQRGVPCGQSPVGPSRRDRAVTADCPRAFLCAGAGRGGLRPTAKVPIAEACRANTWVARTRHTRSSARRIAIRELPGRSFVRECLSSRYSCMTDCADLNR